MDKLFSLFGDVTHTKIGGADSYTDQVNCRYTVYVLFLFAILATARVYVDEPIDCWCPTSFTTAQVAFTNKVCWTSNTFYIPFDKEQTQETRDRHKQTSSISYYQWIALIFCVQGCLFYLPRLLWRMLNKKSGLAVYTITDAAIECQRERDEENFNKNVKFMTHRMSQFLTRLQSRKQVAGMCKLLRLSAYGSYLTIVYLFIKILYVANVIGQLFLLSVFLGTDYHLYGFDVLRRMARGEEWSMSDRFPRVTTCEFYIRTPGDNHKHTVQCALPLNLFYEMMFIFLWFWLVFVAAITVASLLQWIIVSVFFKFQERYVSARLTETAKIADDDDETESGNISKFARRYLCRDGCFILRLVAKNAGDRIAGELAASLWLEYKKMNDLKSVETGEKKSNGRFGPEKQFSSRF